jgi:signal transduction histidine kinase
VFLESADVRLRLDVPAQLPDLTVGSAARHNLFLAAKEALNNIVRHAAASCVNLRVRVLEQSLELEIEDDGRGLGTRSSPEPGADGLANMAHRMAQIQGRCETRSGKTGRGTLVRFTVPLSALDSPTRS